MANNNVMKITTDDFLKAVKEVVKNRMMTIAGATGQGGSPGQLYKPPVTNPGRGEAVYGTEKDGQKFFEFLKASTQIRPNQIMLPFVPKEAETDEQYGEGVDEVELKGLQAQNQGMTIAGQPEFDSFMDRFKKGSSNPKAPSLNHHSPEAQKLILGTGSRIRAM